MITIGSQAPDFSLPGLDGREYALHEALGKGPLVLVFWQAGCGACILAAPYLNRLYDAYENIGWSFWAIAQDDAERARRFVAEHGFRPTALADGPRLAVSDAYDPDSTPALYVIEPSGEVSMVMQAFDKDVLNDVSRRVAKYAGADYVEVAAADDGNPDYRPGCEPLHR